MATAGGKGVSGTPTQNSRSFDTWTKQELKVHLREQNSTLKREKKRLKPSASYDSDFWNSQANISDMEMANTELYSYVQYHNYVDAGGEESFQTWQNSGMDIPSSLKDQKESLQHQAEVSRKQATRLSMKNPGRRVRSAFTKLFHSSRSGFDIQDATQGPRDTSDQSNMRKEMIKAYSDGECDFMVWEPVLGAFVEGGIANAAHLFPYRSIGSMDAIFGEGSIKELFTPYNGLFLHQKIENALKKGVLAIVPDVWFDEGKLSIDYQSKQDNQLQKWICQEVRDYKVTILDPNDQSIKKKIFHPSWYNGIESLADLHNRKLQFLNDNRPRARYIWWTFLAAIHKASWRQKQNNDNLIRREVLKGTRYWGTAGRYVSKNLLAAFVEELGQNCGDLLSNALEDDDKSGDESDPLGVLLITEESVSHAKKRVREATENDSDEEDEENEEDDSPTCGSLGCT